VEFADFRCHAARYAHAIDSGYRFYSYGDACLLFRATSPHV
jgi:S-adenosylmethionine:tRNA ribosyltransferase-isomerase